MEDSNKTIIDIDDLVTEEEAAELLGIQLSTLRQKIYTKLIPEDYFITLINGRRRYFKSKLLSPRP